MKANILKFLKFCSLLDRSGSISITNCTLIVLTVKLALVPTFSIPEVAAFFLALMNYLHKRHEANKQDKVEKVTATNSAIESLQQEIVTMKDQFVTVAKQAEDAKRTITAQTISSSMIPPFVPRNKRPTQE